MTSSGASENKNENYGFAGLSSMVSDIDATLATAARHERKAPRASSSEKRSAPSSKPQNHIKSGRQTPTSQSAGGSSAGKSLLLLLVIVGSLWLLYQMADTEQRPSTTSTRPSTTKVTPPNSSPEQAPITVTVPEPTVPTRPTETKPPVGRDNVLAGAQIRYCVAEKIRLDAAEGQIDGYAHASVDRFNGYVDDYNIRCGQFRYRQGALERARRELEPFRGEFESEGRSRFTVNQPEKITQPPVTSPPSAAKKSEELELLPKDFQSIQRTLNDLGYNAGPVDGIPGARTRAAIKAFQADVGLTQDGNVTEALMQRLIEENAKSSAARVALTSQRGQGTQPPTDRARTRVPKNASLNYFGNDWVCNRGYFRSGSECKPVQVPQNASLDYFGSDWTCDRGYFRSGSECKPVQVPRNASLDYFGSDWICNRGYFRSGSECKPVQVPQNASLDYFGSDWTCNRGYFRSGPRCEPVQVPQNASLDYFGTGWQCKPGYLRVGSRCESSR